VFLREHRHELFDEQFQAELAGTYADSPKGQPPVPPAQLALATILQAYAKVGDDEVIEATVMDRRWQLVLDCMGAEKPPFSKGILVGFRRRLIESDLDRRLVERTVELAAAMKGFGARALRAALDSSPLWGAGRAEDTFNLMGHALRKALGGVLGLLERGEAFVAGHAGDEAAATAVAAARQVRDQDVDLARPAPALRRGVARGRRVSVEDGEMRHGRKSRSVLFDGYKRHVLRDLDTGLVRVVGITPANAPEASVTGDIAADLEAAGWRLAELHIDRAYLSSELVRDRGPGLAVFCKAWRVRNTGGRFAKDQFSIDFDTRQLTCPSGVSMPFEPGKTVRFPKATCTACPLRQRCTTSSTGRSVSIHPDEALLAELRQRQQTPEGRGKLRERVQVEHALAHVGHWQGRRARYLGTRKNLFDLRRVAVVHNLHIIARQALTDGYQLAA
jgi:transposase